MHLPPAHGRLNLRTERSTKRYCDTLKMLRDSEQQDANPKAQKRARKLGVSLYYTNPLSRKARDTWVFGPHPDTDCVYQATPQIALHGCDEGTNAKLARGTTALAVHEGAARWGHSSTKVRDT
jgi:hypothetical protein